MSAMIKSEREDLQRLVRQREKVQISAAKQRSAEQTSEALEERAQQWSKRQRDAYVQELADRFEPDEEPPF
jgi:hypothetical protein